jgi:hypothetical protein
MLPTPGTRHPTAGCTAAPRLPSADAQAQAAEAARQVAAAQVALLSDGPVLSASATDASAPKLGPQDFEILKVVGQGAFGKVRGLLRGRGGSTGRWRGRQRQAAAQAGGGAKRERRQRRQVEGPREGKQ